MSQKEFWIVNSENVPFQKGWFYRAYDLQRFMEKIEKDPRGGKIIGMNFDGKNVEFYTQASTQQLKESLEDKA
ncbi:MAG TPA: hypothetical protein ENH95_06055 [Nitrosopumilus sp.]|nr:hypothetical protein [Nitrosopumilus sp.]